MPGARFGRIFGLDSLASVSLPVCIPGVKLTLSLHETCY